MLQAMLIRQLFDRETSTYTYLVADLAAGVAALVDPVLEHRDRDLRLLGELGVRLALVLETHVHADHVTSASDLRQRTGCATVGSVRGAPCIDRHVREGDVVELGALRFRVLETPGHTDDSLCFEGEGVVFTGDTLLIRGTGRTDFQNGDAGALWDSVTAKLFTLPDATRVLPGHDYKGLSESTIGEEKRWNPRLAGKTRDETIAILGSLDLPPPKHIAEAVPRNLACGVAKT